MPFPECLRVRPPTSRRARGNVTVLRTSDTVHPGSDWQSFCAAAAAGFTTPFPEMRLASPPKWASHRGASASLPLSSSSRISGWSEPPWRQLGSRSGYASSAGTSPNTSCRDDRTALSTSRKDQDEPLSEEARQPSPHQVDEGLTDMAVLTGIALKADHSFESQVRCAGALPRIPETRCLDRGEAGPGGVTASWLHAHSADGTSRSVIDDLAREALCAIRIGPARPLASSPHLAVGKITMGHTLKAGRAIGGHFTQRSIVREPSRPSRCLPEA